MISSRSRISIVLTKLSAVITSGDLANGVYLSDALASEHAGCWKQLPNILVVLRFNNLLVYVMVDRSLLE